MEAFDAVRFYKIARLLGWSEAFCAAPRVDEIVPEASLERFKGRMDEVRKDCEHLGLRVAAIHLREVIRNLSQGISWKDLALVSRGLGETIRRELMAQFFFRVPSDRQHLFDAQASFGGEVGARFPSAEDDIRHAGNCLATECATAAVFHLGRAAARGVNALWKALGKTSSNKGLSWEEVLLDLEYEQSKPVAEQPPFWRTYPALCGESIAAVRAIKNAWRDHTLHVERTYNESQAMRIFTAVEHFLQTLAAVLDESGSVYPESSAPSLPFSPPQ